MADTGKLKFSCWKLSASQTWLLLHGRMRQGSRRKCRSTETSVWGIPNARQERQAALSLEYALLEYTIHEIQQETAPSYAIQAISKSAYKTCIPTLSRGLETALNGWVCHWIFMSNILWAYDSVSQYYQEYTNYFQTFSL